MAASPNGTNLAKGKGTLMDVAGNVFSYATPPSRRGAQVNKGGVSTAFPGGLSAELWYQNGSVFGRRWDVGWYRYTGSAWVTANPATNM